MNISASQEQKFRALLGGIDADRRTLRMKEYIQHGSTSTYDHCIAVARMSYRIRCRLSVPMRDRELVRGAVLHDYFLYDWHSYRGPLHGYHHAETALQNAVRDFEDLTPCEKDIIRSHMWPLNLFCVPHCREALVVCLADKLVSAGETLRRRSRIHRTAGDAV
ncbi:HD domain-containing protein [Lachnoclostridium sp. Marseille-P6806]|uniref:HD domain-containing protein n=1 Tax=Lachnoclostridium sp. Marseille-P6806 TaxID=2364793 RepID=UPI00103025AE|nr:HD domain-containing protein [Lachnoclostridium sp. Marseille-P6806]